MIVAAAAFCNLAPHGNEANGTMIAVKIRLKQGEFPRDLNFEIEAARRPVGKVDVKTTPSKQFADSPNKYGPDPSWRKTLPLQTR